MRTLENFIDGAFRPALEGATEPVLNPATGEPIAQAPLSSSADVDLAVAAARRAFGEWSQTTPAARATALLALADAIEEHGDEIAREEAINAGPVALDGVRAGDVDAVLARGCVGVSVPAGALGGRAAVAALAPALARLETLGAPLFVHPGPGLGERAPEAPAAEAPWWSALTTYVHQMQTSWLGFVAFARPAHPRLRVVFAMLAGNAPLLGERMAARGGPRVDLADPLTFYETSSFGEAAIGVLAGVTGADRLVYGSDRPVVEPPAGAHVRALAENGAWLVPDGRDGRLRR